MPYCEEWMRDRYLVMMRSGQAKLDGRVERPELSIRPLNHDQTFTGVSGCPFPWVDEESILSDDEVQSSQAGWTVRRGHNFLSGRWIAIKLLLEFPDALFHGVDEESIVGDDEVWSSQAGWTV